MSARGSAAVDNVLMRGLGHKDALAPALPPALKDMYDRGIHTRLTRLAHTMLTAPPDSPAQVGARKQLARISARQPVKIKNYIQEHGDMDRKDLNWFKHMGMKAPGMQTFLRQGAALRNKLLNQRYARGKGQGSVIGGMRVPTGPIDDYLQHLQGRDAARMANYDLARQMEDRPKYRSGLQAFSKWMEGENELGDVVKSFIT